MPILSKAGLATSDSLLTTGKLLSDGTLQAKIIPCNLVQLVHESVSLCAAAAGLADIECTVAPDIMHNSWIKTDPEFFRRLLPLTTTLTLTHTLICGFREPRMLYDEHRHIEFRVRVRVTGRICARGRGRVTGRICARGRGIGLQAGYVPEAGEGLQTGYVPEAGEGLGEGKMP